MIIELEMADGRTMRVNNFSELCFTQTVNVACDSLWACFVSDDYIGEISKVRACIDDKLVFNGYCDCQRNTLNQNGYEIYFYARSGAAVLVDNEAEPFTYEKPSAKQLCFNIAGKYGFKSGLDEVFSNMKYEVTSGTSCFGAINQFVSMLTGEHIVVTPDNVIRSIKLSDDIKRLDLYKIISLTQTINRSEPYSQINYKKSSSQPRYDVHTKSRTAQKLGIDRQMYINLSSLPQWQRENTVLQRLIASYENYNTAQITVSGYFDGNLLQRYSYGNNEIKLDDFALYEKKYVCDKNGECTKLVLKKNIDVKELTYVD